MSTPPDAGREPLVVPPGQGRHYAMGRMSAVFKADGPQTRHGYSISEWWLEPKTRGPGAHSHPDDHVFYIIEGTVSVQIAQQWFHAAQGSYVQIPGGTLHDFENRGVARSGFISINVPGGFEEKMPYIVQALNAQPVGDVTETLPG